MDAKPLSHWVKVLTDYHGGLRPTARLLDVDVSYLFRLRKGLKNAPGPKLLRKMGLRKVVYYEPIPKGLDKS